MDTINSQTTVNKPLVSVILTAYKEKGEIFSLALESILQQTFDDFEILIIIDNPNDTELNDLAHEYSKNDGRIRIFKNSSNLGLPTSLNKAINLAKGSYICRMDADDISYKDRIRSQFEYLTDNQLDLIGGIVEVINENGDTLYTASNIPFHSSQISSALKWNNVVPHPTWFGKSIVFRQMYRPIPFCEDYDFLIRSVLSNYKLGNINTPILKYRMSAKSISRSNLYEQYLSQCFLSKKYRQGKVVEIVDVSNFIKKKNNASKSLQYCKANAFFNKSLMYFRSNKIANALFYFLKTCTSSKDYCNKLRRMLFASLTKLK